MVINPQKIEFYIPAKEVIDAHGQPRHLQGLEIDSDDLLQHKISSYEHPKIKYCVSHFVDGISWNELPTENAPAERYFRLDCIFKEVKESGILKDVPGDNILIHLFNGVPYFAGGGFHRLAIALILGLYDIPVDISLVRR